MENSCFVHKRLADVQTAISLLSRLPVPYIAPAAFERSAGSVWAYPLVGLLLALVSVCFGVILMWIGLNSAVAAGALIASKMVMTGAVHEDGLADTTDGFWGSWKRDRRLEIMKDSHIGTYGVLALIVVTGLRWAAYATLLPVAPMAVLVTAALSRSVMPGVMATLPHARSTGLSKSVGQPSVFNAAIAFGIGAAISVILLGPVGLMAAGLAALTAFSVGALAKAKIGGQTGDVLGAVQQLSEVVVLLCLITIIT